MGELTLVTLWSAAMTPQQQAEALAGMSIDPIAVLESIRSNIALFNHSQDASASAQSAKKRVERPKAATVYAMDTDQEVKPVFGINAGPVSSLRATAVTLSFLDDLSLGRMSMASRRGRDSLGECGFQLFE